MYELIIIGGGPGGIAAGIYAARKKIKTLLITETFGGQSFISADIQNWIGTKSVSGFDFAKMLEEHLRAQEDIEILDDDIVTAVDPIRNEVSQGAGKIDGGFRVKTKDEKSFDTKYLLIASGSNRRKLNVLGEKELDGKGVSYCSICLPPDEQIVANSSLKNIAEIKDSQLVLTGDGSFQRVKETMEREYDGELIAIRTRFFSEEVRLTPNHPVLATTIEKGTGPNYWKDFRINKPVWLPAGGLTETQALLYPIISETQDVNVIRASDILTAEVVGNEVRNAFETHTARRIPNELPIDGKFMRLAGYYLSEGCATDKGVTFNFSSREREYLQDVSNIVEHVFRFKPAVRIKKNVGVVEVNSILVRDLFEFLFGKYAHGKRVPHWMLFLPVEKLAELVKGVYRGDGCKRKKDFCIVTNSRMLTYQLRDIFLRLGMIPLIQRRTRDVLNRKPGNIDGRAIRFNHDKYHIVVGGPSLEKMSEVLGLHHEKVDTRRTMCHHAWLDESFVYLPIRSIGRVQYRGKVHNLAVEGNNTYIAKNFIIHNCDAPLFKGKDVAVIGGGNSGVEAVIDLLPYAAKIYLLEYAEALKADPVTIEKIKSNQKVEIFTMAETIEILGNSDMLTGLKYKDRKTDAVKELQLGGVFVEIGAVPNSGFVKGLVEMNQFGEIIADPRTQKTSVPGIWAAGDVTDVRYKQNNISAGDAIKAILDIDDRLHKK